MSSGTWEANDDGSLRTNLNYYRRPASTGVRLEINKHRHYQLYGRDAQLEILDNLQAGIVSSKQRQKVVWVHGESGTGKSCLCRAALAQNDDDKAYLCIEGKYNQLYTSTTTPYSAIINAFDNLGKQVMVQHDDETLDKVKECLEYEANILTRLIPSFSSFSSKDEQERHDAMVREDSQHVDDGVDTNALQLASERLAVAFRSFLRAFTCTVKPLVLFVDDFQWSDVYSQELIAAILHDTELNNLLFVGAFRDDDPELLKAFFHNMEDIDNVVDIALTDLDLDSVNQLLARILSRANLQMTLPLAQVVHCKTHGNPYFCIQLLEQLNAQSLLTYSLATNQWEWELESVKAGTNVSDNVVNVVTRRLQGIPLRVQRILKLAACLGFFVDADLLQRLDLAMEEGQLFIPSDDDDTVSHAVEQQQDLQHEDSQPPRFEAALQRAEEEGFVERAGNIVKFTHDRVQQCVYNLIEEGHTRDMWHHQLGKYLGNYHKDATDLAESSRFLFLAVDQLNRGSSLIDNDEGRLSLIILNHEASKIAKQNAGIESVSSFLAKAVDLVQPSFWLYHYELILEIYNSSAEVDFSLGKLDEAKKTIEEEIMANAVRKKDTVRALVVIFQMYGLRCQYKEAISHGCEILRLLGEPMPKKVTMFHVLMEYIKARGACKNKPDDFFTKLPPTVNTDTQTVLKILQIGAVFGWNADQNFSGLAFLRGFRFTVREGSSMATPFLYSGYGFMLGLFGQYDEAFRFGELALKTRRGEETFPSACTLTYANLMHLQLPLGNALEPYLSAYRVGLETGDLFFGTICISCYALIHVTCGLPLAPFATDLLNFGDQLRICHQDLQLAFMLPSYQLALNLMGRSDDPLDLSRDAIKRQQRLFSDNLLLCEEASRVVNADILYMWYLQLYNSYILEDATTMNKTLKRIMKLKKEARRFGGTHMMNYFLPFMDGLVGLWLAKKEPKSRMGPKVAKAAIAELSKVSKTRPVNSITPLKLLRAEVAARKKSMPTEKARSAYEEVIAMFSRSGLNHFSAIANELAGKFMLERKDMDWGEYYLGKALAKWNEYNAFVKVKLMVEEYPFLESVSQAMLADSKQSVSIQGRARFDVATDSLPSSKATTSARSSRELHE